MAKTPTKPPKTNSDTPDHDRALALGLRKGGWVVELLHVVEDRVLMRKPLTDPEPKHVASERMKIEFVRRFMQPGGEAND
jgi:hypothetical protein